MLGYYSDYPLKRKVAGKPIYAGSRGGSSGSSRTPRTALVTFYFSVPGPYSWGPDLAKGAGS